MRSFLLLILSLMTGCAVSFEVKVCPDGWVEFTCKYPKSHKQCGVVLPNETAIHSAQEDVWETKGRVSLYHDAKNEELKVAIRELQNQDSEEYKCQCDEHEQEVEIGEIEEDSCQRPFTQTAYRSAKTTITCDYPEDKSSVKIFCKDNGVICEDIFSTNSSQSSNRNFTLIETETGFSISISDVSSGHAGVYWCGVKSQRYRAAHRKIQLKVGGEDITELKEFPTIGQNFTYLCVYPNGSPIKKFICKGEDPFMCEHLASTAQRNTSTGRFSMKENIRRTNATITVREVTADDTGTYWVGAERSDETHSNLFFHRLVMTVVSSTTLTPSVTSPTSRHPVATSTVSSTQSTTVTADKTQNSDHFRLILIIAGVVCGAGLVLVFLLVFIYNYKRKNTRNGKAQNIKEDGTYAEIQERPHKPDSGTTLKTIYVTADVPTNPSASHHYSSIFFQNGSGKVSGDTYSAVGDKDRHPTYSTVNHPSTFSKDPFYSTVNRPQQH